MMAELDEVDLSSFDYCNLTPNQRECIKRAAMRRARIERSKVVFEMVGGLAHAMRRTLARFPVALRLAAADRALAGGKP